MKNPETAHHETAVREKFRPRGVFTLLGLERRQFRRRDEYRKTHERHGDHEIRHLKRVDRRGRKNEIRSDERSHSGPERIERLDDGEAARSRLRTTEERDVRIRGDLDQGDTRGQNEERTEKEAEYHEVSGGQKTERAEGRDAEARIKSALVAVIFAKARRRDRNDKVRREESELNQSRLGIRQREGLLQMRDEYVVQTRDESEKEEKTRDDH